MFLIHQVETINSSDAHLVGTYNFDGVNPLYVVSLLVLSVLIEQHEPAVVPAYPNVAIQILSDGENVIGGEGVLLLGEVPEQLAVLIQEIDAVAVGACPNIAALGTAQRYHYSAF